MSRVDSVEIAISKAADRVQGAVLSSDAFFPFPDGLETAAKGGISVVVQPGGSIRDGEVIEAVCGWAPDDAIGVFELRSAELVGAKDGALIFQLEFTLNDQLRITT